MQGGDGEAGAVEAVKCSQSRAHAYGVYFLLAVVDPAEDRNIRG